MMHHHFFLSSRFLVTRIAPWYVPVYGPALALVMACFMMAANPTSVAAAEPDGLITIQLASGRTYRGTVDSQTDEQELWFQYGTERFKVIRPIAWERVTGAKIDGSEFTGEELKQQIFVQESDSSPMRLKKQPDQVTVAMNWNEVFDTESAHQSRRRSHGAAKIQTTDTPGDDLPQRTRARVATISVDAYLSNWDADAVADGLSVYVTPLDKAEQGVPTSGLVQIELWSHVKRSYRALGYSHRGEARRIGYWAKTIQSAQWTPRGYRVRLPFQSLDPSHDERVSRFGTLRVKLVAPGVGTFEAEPLNVRIKRF